MANLTRTKRTINITTSLIIAGAPLAALAQDQVANSQQSPENAASATTSDIEALDPSTVTASRSLQSIAETPYTASVIDRQNLDDRLIRSIPDAFSSIPGVLIQKTGYSQGSPFIRGFSGRQNLILVDGIRMNNSTWRSGPVQYWNTFDQENLASLELIKGQGSVLYGSDAIGGTVNLLSRSSDFRNQSGFFTHGRTHYRFDTNSQSHVGRLEATIGEGQQWGLMFGLTGKDFGDIKDSAVGRMRNTGYSEQAFDLKFEYAISDSATLTLAHQYLNQDDGNRWHRTASNPGWIHNGRQLIADQSTSGARIEIYDQERSLTYARLEGTLDDSFIDQYTATLSYQKTQDSTFRERTNISGNIDTKVIDLETYGFDLQLQSELGPGKLVYGADYYRDEANSTAARNGTFRPGDRPVADDSSYDLFGIFAQYQWKLINKLEITTGARYSYAQAKWNGYRPAGASVDQSGDSSWDDISVSLRGNYELNNQWSIYGGVSQAFRAPNLNDLTGNTFSLNGLNSSGSINAEPEEYLNYEIGTRYLADDYTIGITTYYNDRQDTLARVDNGMGGITSSNDGQGYAYGIELDSSFRIADNWETRVFAAWQDGKEKSPNVINGALVSDTINRIHPFMGGASLRWTHPNKRFWIEPSIKAAAAATNLNAALDSSGNDNTRIPKGGTPNYFITSLYTGYQVNDNLEITLGFENLTDDDYRYHGSGQNELGFNILFGLTAKF